MGFFSKIGSALKNPDLRDNLAAAAMAWNGDMQGAMAARDRVAGRRDMDRVTEIMEREGFGRPTGNAPGEEVTPIEMQEAVVRRAPPPLLNMDSAGQVSGDLSAPPAGVPNLPQQAAPTPPKSLYMTLAPDLMRMSQRGQNVQPVMNMLMQEDYVRGLPMQDQAAARAVGADRFATWKREDSAPQYIETPGAIIGLDRRTAREIGRIELPQKPEPVTPDRIQGAVLAKYQRGEPLSPQETEIYNRWKSGSDGFYGERAPQRQSTLDTIIGKLNRGEPLGAGEQQYWDTYKSRGSSTGNPLAGITGADTGGDDDENAAPAPPAPKAPPGAPTLPPKTPPAPKTPPLDRLQEGRPTTFENGQVWTKKAGQAVRLK